MSNSINRAWCEYVIGQCLLGQEWGLVAPSEIADEVWPIVEAQGVQGEEAKAMVQTGTWQLYGIHLHNACCNPTNKMRYERAWHELRSLLVKQVTRHTDNPYQQEEGVQMTLLRLHNRFQRGGLDAPHMIYLFCRQTLKSTIIDLWRKEDKTRGQTVEWEEEGEADEVSYAWSLEEQVMNKDTRQRLETFFAEHLPTDFQQVVAQAHFIDGLTPAKIAGLLGRKPHEVRLTKARVVKKLKNLSPAAHQQLVELLKK